MAFTVDIKFIEKAENELGLTFPNSFKKGISKSNGGEVNTKTDLWEIFPIFDTSDRKRTCRTANHIIRETKAANGWKGFPPKAIAIASNGGGDLAILLPEAQNINVLEDKVYRWSHETAKVSMLCPNCEVWFNDINQKANKDFLKCTHTATNQPICKAHIDAIPTLFLQ